MAVFAEPLLAQLDLQAAKPGFRVVAAEVGLGFPADPVGRACWAAMHRNHAFSLIGLFVVIAIIATLVAWSCRRSDGFRRAGARQLADETA
jgi:hypothetical protein